MAKQINAFCGNKIDLRYSPKSGTEIIKWTKDGYVIHEYKNMENPFNGELASFEHNGKWVSHWYNSDGEYLGGKTFLITVLLSQVNSGSPVNVKSVSGLSFNLKTGEIHEYESGKLLGAFEPGLNDLDSCNLRLKSFPTRLSNDGNKLECYGHSVDIENNTLTSVNDSFAIHIDNSDVVSSRDYEVVLEQVLTGEDGETLYCDTHQVAAIQLSIVKNNHENEEIIKLKEKLEYYEKNCTCLKIPDCK